MLPYYQPRKFNPRKGRKPLQTVIPKSEFVKLRRWVLDYLKRNGDANGHCNIPHDLTGMFLGTDLRPFAGMSNAFRGSALNTFWECLLKNKLVEKAIDPQGGVYYHLPDIPPFHQSTVELFKAMENGASVEDIIYGDRYDSQNIPEGK